MLCCGRVALAFLKETTTDGGQLIAAQLASFASCNGSLNEETCALNRNLKKCGMNNEQ